MRLVWCSRPHKCGAGRERASRLVPRLVGHPRVTIRWLAETFNDHVGQVDVLRNDQLQVPACVCSVAGA